MLSKKSFNNHFIFFISHAADTGINRTIAGQAGSDVNLTVFWADFRTDGAVISFENEAIYDHDSGT